MKVLILMGSDSDLPVMEKSLVKEAERKGAEVIICGAGMAAHLAGAVAAQTILPVIGIPLSNSPLNGMDALLSTVQMPPGVPVATVAIGKAGAKNAAVLAAQIIARKDKNVLKKLRAFRKKQSGEVERKAEGIG
jgi:phosphoribosylaminoimidazole carboxylase PurE protein